MTTNEIKTIGIVGSLFVLLVALLLEWLYRVTANDIKTIGIIGSLFVSLVALLFNIYSIWRSIRSQRIANYQELVKSHRDLWKLTLDAPEIYSRVSETNVDLITIPISYQERKFCQLLFLHMTAAYAFYKYSNILPIEKLEFDFHEVLLNPIPRLIWEDNRSKYYNSDFQHFLNNSAQPRGIKRLLMWALGKPNPDYTKVWRVLLLGAFAEDIADTIIRLGDKAICMPSNQDITKRYLKEKKIDYVVCFGYKRRLNRKIFSTVPCVNIHSGYLPSNKGLNPHVWAWIDDLPHGVSMHYIDAEINCGDIIAQSEVIFLEPVTLQVLKDTIKAECIRLFANEWPKMRVAMASKTKQTRQKVRRTLQEQTLLARILDESSPDTKIGSFCRMARQLLMEVPLPDNDIKERAK